MTVPPLPRGPCALLGGLLLWSLPAAAQEIPAAPEVPKAPTVPSGLLPAGDDPTLERRPLPWRVIGLEDPADTACDPMDARYGTCLEWVQFRDLSDDWGPSEREARPVSAPLRATSAAAASAWEALAYRWFMAKEAPERTAQADGILALPAAADTWDAAFPAHNRTVALPDKDAWLTDQGWMGPDGLFRPVAWKAPDGVPALPPTILLAGRFAARLGYQGRPHPYEVMDADPTSSAPFFEQMFPYESASENFGPAAVPLSAYGWPDQLTGLDADAGWADRVRSAAVPLLSDDTLNAYRGRVHRAFEEEFDRLLGVSVTSYALEDYTINQMRVLAALNLMRAPPGLLARQSGRSRDIVAAALGQTDATEDATDRLDRSVFAFQGGFELKYEQIPQDVVLTWLNRLLLEYPPDAALIGERWAPEVMAQLREVIDPRAPAPTSMAPEELERWLGQHLRTGIEVGPFLLDAERLTLQVLVWNLPDSVREEKETWILIDHVHDTLSASLNQTEGEAMTPEEIAGLAMEAWGGTIAAHGRRTRPISQGLGAVDPTSICTTQDGRAALGEAVIGVHNLDLLIAAKPGQTNAEDVLWEKRDSLPWVLVDDPQTSEPVLTPLVTLSDGRTLYRVRWKVWSGWHLMWSPELLPTGQRRMAVRTAAVCEDMALTAPELVPTLVRAALLDGDLRPTTPVARKDARHKLREDRRREDSARQGGQPKDGAPEETPPARPDRSAEVSYLQGLARAPLQKLAGDTKGLLVLALELTPNAPRERLPRWNSPTPYLRLHRGLGERRVRASAWGRYFPASQAAPSGLVPDLRPDQSVATEHPRPTWHPVIKTDWDASGGLSYLPVRWSSYVCEDQDGTNGSVTPCSDKDADGSLLSEGLGLDLNTGSTFWLLDHPRVAAELGASFRLDMVHSGESAIYGLFAPEDTPSWLPEGPTYAWTFRFAGGPVVGLRFAPLPGGLWRVGDGWPWGAERPDGKSRLARSEGGVRLGFLFGPGYNGLEGTALGEVWWARSLHFNKGAYTTFTPYHPNLMIGPFAQGQLGFLPFGTGVDRTLVLDRSVTGLVGVRVQLQLQAPAPALPEAK